MPATSDLLRRYFQTFVEDTGQWQTLIAEDIVWESVHASSIKNPATLSGREEVIRHVTQFLGALENFRFFDLKIHAFTDLEWAVAEVKAEGLIKAQSDIYRQEYVLFVRSKDGKIAYLREYSIL